MLFYPYLVVCWRCDGVVWGGCGVISVWCVWGVGCDGAKSFGLVWFVVLGFGEKSRSAIRDPNVFVAPPHRQTKQLPSTTHSTHNTEIKCHLHLHPILVPPPTFPQTLRIPPPTNTHHHHNHKTIPSSSPHHHHNQYTKQHTQHSHTRTSHKSYTKKLNRSRSYCHSRSHKQKNCCQNTSIRLKMLLKQSWRTRRKS